MQLTIIFLRGCSQLQQWQQHGMPTLSLWRLLGSASLSSVQWLLLNNQPWTTFGAGIKGTYFCFSHTESFFWKCKVSMQAGEKHLLSCFQFPCHKRTEQGWSPPCPRGSDFSPQHWATIATEMLKIMPDGHGQPWFFLKTKNVTNCHNANANWTIKAQLILIYLHRGKLFSLEHNKL